MNGTSVLKAEVERLGIETALVTNFYFKAYNGSPIVAFDIAVTLRRCGVKVSIATCALGEPLRSKAAAAGVTMIDIDPISATLDLAASYDLLWGQHWPVYVVLRDRFGLRARYIAFSTLSPFEPLESLPPSAIEADVVVFNSSETLLARGGGIEASRRHLLPNSLPDEWFGPTTAVHVDAPLVSVSNNQTPDLDSALNLLALTRPDIRLSRVGQRHGQKEVDVGFVDGARALVSIGHSVQKAIARERPVYVYDRFGGPGWLTPDIFDFARARNFSGRGFGFKSPEHIAEELASPPDVDNVRALRELATRHFDLGRNLAAIFSRLSQKPGPGGISPRRTHDLAAAEEIINLSQRRSAFPSHMIETAEVVCIDVDAFNASARKGRPGVRNFWVSTRAARQLCCEADEIVVDGAAVLKQGLPDAVSLRFADAVVRGAANLPSPQLAQIAPADPRFLNARFEVRLPWARVRDTAILQLHVSANEIIELGELRFTRTPVRGGPRPPDESKLPVASHASCNED